MELRNNCIYMPRLIESEMGFFVNDKVTQPSAAYVLKRDSANDITITQMFITLAIMLEVY